MSKLWKKIPSWARKTIVGAVETSVVAYLVYFIAALEGKASVELSMIILIALKAILQGLRTNPDVPIKDYVNGQK